MPWARGPANYKQKSSKQLEIGCRNVEYVDIITIGHGNSKMFARIILGNTKM